MFDPETPRQEQNQKREKKRLKYPSFKKHKNKSANTTSVEYKIGDKTVRDYLKKLRTYKKYTDKKVYTYLHLEALLCAHLGTRHDAGIVQQDVNLVQRVTQLFCALTYTATTVR